MMTPDKEFLGRNRACRTVLVGLLAIFFFLSSPSAWAHPTASISGTVFDPSGAVVAGATVILHDAEHGVQQSSATNDDGSYAFPALPPSHYRIEIHAPGFKPYLRTDLELGAADALKIDVSLALNSESTTVEVSAESLQADTSTSQIGQTIAGKKMTGVPLNGRSFTDLLAIQPGVIPASLATDERSGDGRMHGDSSFRRLESWERVGERAARNREWVRGKRQQRRRRL